MSSNFVKLMKSEGLRDEVIRTFESYYEKLAKGEKASSPNNKYNLLLPTT